MTIEQMSADQIRFAEATILEEAKKVVRRVVPFADDSLVERRAKAIVEAARAKSKSEGEIIEKVFGVQRVCETCRWGNYSRCRHALSIRYETDKSARKERMHTMLEMRSENGACGPEGILWTRRSPWQRWFDMEGKVWWVMPVTAIAAVAAFAIFIFLMVFISTIF